MGQVVDSVVRSEFWESSRSPVWSTIKKINRAGVCPEDVQKKNLENMHYTRLQMING